MSPPVTSDETIFASLQSCRTFISVLEVLQTRNDVVIVDAAPLIAGVRHALYGLADQIVFVASRDPSGAFANRQALSVISGYLKPECKLTTVVNGLARASAPISIIRDQVVQVEGRAGKPLILPYVARAARWPCSGATPYRYVRRTLSPLFYSEESVGLCSTASAVKRSGQNFQRFLRAVKGLFRARKAIVGSHKVHEAIMPAMLPGARVDFGREDSETALISKAVVTG
jgi:hypothetical protein